MKGRRFIYTTGAFVFLLVGLIIGIAISTSLKLPSPAVSIETQEKLDENGKPLPTTENISKVIKEVTPSVVTITSTKVVKVEIPGFDDFFFFSPFFESPFGFGPRREQEYKQRGLGSGVIVSSDGYILTNNHVIAGAQEIKVRVENKFYDAKLIGSDAKTDLAVLKIEGENFKAVRMGDSDSLEVGEWVIAIGSPFELEHTSTLGIISAKGRSRVGIADYEDFLQTDAAINPGNSGGALVNLKGELIGINTAIASSSGGYQGIGFAIPVNMAKQVMEMIITKGKVVRGWLGVRIQDVTDDIAQAIGLKEAKGVIISEVLSDSPAEKAGLKQGDVIIELDGKEFVNGSDFRNNIALKKPGTTVNLTVIRDGSRRNIQAVLGELPSEERVAQKEEPSKETKKKLGISVSPLSPYQADNYGVSGGMIIKSVEPGSPAQKAGLRDGDIILEINGIRTTNYESFSRATASLRPINLFLIKRDANVFYIPVRVD